MGLGWMAVGLGMALQIGLGATVQDILPELVANGERYAAALPSLSCEETAVSQRTKGGKVKETVTLEALMRVERTGDVLHPFDEHYEWKTRNGAAVEAGKGVKAPYFVEGAFANGLVFSTGKRMGCFDMGLSEAGSTAVLTLRKKAGASGDPECAAMPAGVSSRVVIDRANGHVTRVERSVPAAEAEQWKAPVFAAIDYAPVVLGTETFWLPVRAEMRDANDERRMTATYRGCKRFTGSMTIVGGVGVVP